MRNKKLKLLAIASLLVASAAFATQGVYPIPFQTNPAGTLDAINQVIAAVNPLIIAGGTGGTGGIIRVVQAKAINFPTGCVASTDYVYFVSGGITATLCAAAGNTNLYTFIDTDGSTVTLSGTVNGTVNPTLTLTNQSMDIISNGTSYNIK